MRLTVLLMLAAILQVSARTSAQTVSYTGRDVSIQQVFSAIEKQTGYVFFYVSEDLRGTKPVTLDLKNMPLMAALQMALQSQPLEFEVQGNTIAISRKAALATITPGTGITITAALPPVTGFVRTADGKPLQGASVRIKGTTTGVVTDESGRFTMIVEPGQTLVITYLGYQTREVRLVNVGAGIMTIVMTSGEESIREVVINTGIIKRDKASFTGAATVYTGEQLKTVGNKNILESLRSLDPSFIKVENNIQGSNPNTMPTFEIRGQTTINTNSLNDQFNQDPNQPLFILDGFETTLQMIYDMDMNRVASITILKDAASTALYGAKAANGVVVVETKRPVPGKLQMSYTSDMTLEMPDLTSYNLMNAAEKLEYERLQGVYYPTGQYQWENEVKYNQRLAEVQRGVNTYWLNEPVRTGLSHRHSLQLNGGNNEFVFSAAASYGKTLGVMKGSGRDTWSGNIGLSYRKGKININNQLSVSGTTGDESPYGSFSSFALAIPYYRKQNPDGTIPKLLDNDPSSATRVANPLYNASLFSINQRKDFNFFNNLNAIYNISRVFRLQAAIQLSKGNSKTAVFIPPDNTQFDNTTLREKGSYTGNHLDDYAYSTNLMITYGETIGKSQFSATLRGELSETNGVSEGFSAVGFPYGTDGNPVYAYSYKPFSTPAATNTRTRSAGILASFNYALDQRFMFDAIYRLDGASVFGTNHTFKPFLSGGVGWNISQEPYLRDSRNINLLKLRANAGWTGNENLGQFSSISTYSFQTGNNNTFGQGLTLASLGNPSLDWQRTLQTSYGLDFGLWQNRISGYIEYFEKKTDPLAISAEGVLPSSTGTGSNFVMNVGFLHTKGWNFNLRVLPVNNVAKRIVWSIGVMGSRYNSIYGGLAERLSKLNDQQQVDGGLRRYFDGYSPDDMWAVVSKGIDPATGQELYLKKDGSLTFSYNTDDIVKVGNSRPKIEGGLNTSFTYKEFTFGAVARYRIGGYVMNSALFDKVENSHFQARENMDRRALYDRWKKPGDIAQFTNISNSYAYLSSRFVQEDNHLIGESFSLSWRSYGKWLRDLKLQSLSLTMYLNDIFRLEKIMTERGIDYPYARTGGLSLNVSF